jgi:hypothetical protein
MAATEWKIVGVSVKGFSHQANGTECQDSYAVSAIEGGWLVAMVSDGAGSASRSSEGARALCKGLVAYLGPRVAENNQPDETVVRLWVEESVELVRASLDKSEGRALTEFHATLVGVIAGPHGGAFFHIGDGAGCATLLDDLSVKVMSLPENGEYANETYFFTQSDWKDHLRLTPFGPHFNLIALMSDGVTPFALEPGESGPHSPFFAPVSHFLTSHSREEGERALAATLERDAIRNITGDDKTLVWAARVEPDG